MAKHKIQYVFRDLAGTRTPHHGAELEMAKMFGEILPTCRFPGAGVPYDTTRAWRDTVFPGNMTGSVRNSARKLSAGCQGHVRATPNSITELAKTVAAS